jgi:hypothetical protein
MTIAKSRACATFVCGVPIDRRIQAKRAGTYQGY